MLRASTEKPVSRIVQTKHDGELVMEVRANTLTMRPIRTRRGGPAEVVVTWGSIYTRAQASKAAP